jgi:hypothetical protein
MQKNANIHVSTVIPLAYLRGGILTDLMMFFNCIYYTASNSGIFLNEVERMWKEMVMTYFKVLLQNLPGVSQNSCKTSA